MTSSLSIPPQFQTEGFRFVKLGSSGEGLKKPFEFFWDCLTLEEARRQYAEDLAAAGGDKSKSKRLQAGEPSRLTNYAFDDPVLLQHLAGGRNYGIVNGSGPNGAGLVTLDADNLPRLAELVDLSLLPPTLEAGRRGEDGEPIPERRHFHFISDLEGKHLLKDPDTGEDLGDIRGTGGYQVVGPGSLHPSGARVEVLEDRPIATVTGAEMLEVLKPVLETSSPPKLETDRARLEGLKGLKGKRRPPTATDDPFEGVSILDVINTSGFKESGGQLFGSNPVHGSDTGHNLVVNPAKNSWWCGRHDTGGGPALWLAVEAEIIDCSEATAGSLRGEKYLQVLDYARKRGIIPDDDRGRGESSTEGARDFIETVKEGLKADPRKLKDRAVLAALLTLREKDPLEFDLLTDELKDAGVVKLPTLKKMIDGEERRQADEKAREEEAGERLEIAPDVEREADQILSAGLAFEYLYETWQARHLGDAKVGKALLGGFGAQRCVSTSGIHIQINGPREAGKSHAVEEAVNLLPPRLVMMGSMSNMTLYYDAENMPAGAAVFIDDITYTETFGAVQKRCTTGFQAGATHRSVVDSKDGKVVKKFTTKPRMAFYTTCVDRQQDEQLRSRLWSIDADSSPEHKQAVIDFRKKKDAGLLFDPAEEERKTAVCRAIFEDLDSRLFDVVIPYAERLVTSPGLDVRSYNVISDLTKSLAVYRYRVREKDDRGRVLATEKDFFDAKAIFDATEGHSDIKFTDAELRVLEALADLGFKASMSDLCRKTGLSKSRVDEILNGRGKGEQKRHGLMSKAPITREQESDSWTYDRDPDTGDFRRKTVTQFIYYLDPSFRLQGYKSLIKLETDNGGEVSGGFRKVSVVVSVDDNDNGKEVSGVSVEKTEEEDDNVLPLRGAGGRDGENISSNTCPGKTTETTESPSPLSLSSTETTTETSPETTENPRKPQEQKGEDEDRLPTSEEAVVLVNNPNHRNNRNNPNNRNNRLDSTFEPGIEGTIATNGIIGIIATNAKMTQEGEAVAGEIPDPDDYQSIAENLEEDKRRTAEIAEHVKTPEEDRLPTAEEAEVLGAEARRISDNWPGGEVPEMLLWEKARGKLGSRLPLVVVRHWLSESGYIETATKHHSAGTLWEPLSKGEVV